MTKLEFLAQLRKRLSGLPQDDIEERVIFYSEMIEDRMEEGLSEEDAVAAIAITEESTNHAIADTLPSKPVVNTLNPQRRRSIWAIVLTIMGFPIWFPLGVAAASVVFSVYVAVWCVVICFWAAFTSVACCAFSGILSGAVLACNGHTLPGIAVIGAGITCAGLSVFMFFGCKTSTKGVITLTKKFTLWLKGLFVKKEVA